MAEPWFPYLEIGVPKVMNSNSSPVCFPTALHLVTSALPDLFPICGLFNKLIH